MSHQIHHSQRQINPPPYGIPTNAPSKIPPPAPSALLEVPQPRRPSTLEVPPAQAQTHSPYGFDAISPSARLYTPLAAAQTASSNRRRTLPTPMTTYYSQPSPIVPYDDQQQHHHVPPPYDERVPVQSFPSGKRGGAPSPPQRTPAPFPLDYLEAQQHAPRLQTLRAPPQNVFGFHFPAPAPQTSTKGFSSVSARRATVSTTSSSPQQQQLATTTRHSAAPPAVLSPTTTSTPVAVASPPHVETPTPPTGLAHEEHLLGRVPLVRLPPTDATATPPFTRRSRGSEDGSSSEGEDNRSPATTAVDPAKERVDVTISVLMKQVAFETTEAQLRWVFITLAGVTPVEVRRWGSSGGCWLLTFSSAAHRDVALGMDGQLLWDIDGAVWRATTSIDKEAVEKALADHSVRRRSRDFTDLRLRNVPRTPASIKIPPARGPSRQATSAPIPRNGSSASSCDGPSLVPRSNSL